MKPYLDFKGKTILIHRAPDPSDLFWENLSFSYWRTFLNYLLLYFLAILILVSSFYIQAELKSIVYEYTEANPIFQSNKILMQISGLAASLMIATIN